MSLHPTLYKPSSLTFTARRSLQGHTENTPSKGIAADTADLSLRYETMFSHDMPSYRRMILRLFNSLPLSTMLLYSNYQGGLAYKRGLAYKTSAKRHSIKTLKTLAKILGGVAALGLLGLGIRNFNEGRILAAEVKQALKKPGVVLKKKALSWFEKLTPKYLFWEKARYNVHLPEKPPEPSPSPPITAPQTAPIAIFGSGGGYYSSSPSSPTTPPGTPAPLPTPRPGRWNRIVGSRAGRVVAEAGRGIAALPWRRIGAGVGIGGATTVAVGAGLATLGHVFPGLDHFAVIHQVDQIANGMLNWIHPWGSQQAQSTAQKLKDIQNHQNGAPNTNNTSAKLPINSNTSTNPPSITPFQLQDTELTKFSWKNGSHLWASIKASADNLRHGSPIAAVQDFIRQRNPWASSQAADDTAARAVLNQQIPDVDASVLQKATRLPVNFKFEIPQKLWNLRPTV